MARTAEVCDYRLIIETAGEGEPVAPVVYYSGIKNRDTYYYLDDFQWMNGDHVDISLTNGDITERPFLTNRPLDSDNERLHPEALIFDNTNRHDGKLRFHPITADGWLNLLVHGVERQCRLTLVKVGTIAVEAEDGTSANAVEDDTRSELVAA